MGVLADATPWQSDGSVGAVLTAYGSVVFRVPPLFHSGGDAREENPPTDTIALGFQVDTTVGDLPFYDLPSLGGASTLRGYIANRFTDNSAWHAVAEYRFWVIPRGFRLTRTIRIERVGLAVFGELGTVAPSLGDLPDGQRPRELRRRAPDLAGAAGGLPQRTSASRTRARTSPWRSA